jgi:hypothetical protein
MGLTRIRAEQISDIDFKQAVRAIELNNVTLSGGAPSTVDGVNLVAGNRILVAGQSTASQNGLYDVTVVGSGSNGTWVRTSDANATGEINAGMIVMVTEGSTWADTSWKLVTNDPIVIGVTGLEFLQNTGNSFSIIDVVGSANVVANGVSSTVSFASGNNFSVTGNNASDVITFAVVDSPSFVGNVTAGYFIGNGALLSNITGANVTGTVANAVFANSAGTANTANSATVAVTVTANAQPNITSVGTLTTLSVTGNVSAGNILTANTVINTGVSTTGNVTAAYYFGNGINLTGLANVTFAASPPANAVIGDVWIDSGNGIQYLYYNDLTGNVWAEMEAQTAFSSTGFANLTTNTLNTQVLYNSANAVVGSNNLVFDGTTLTAVNLTAGNLAITGNTITSNAPDGNLSISTQGTGELNITAHSLEVYTYSNAYPTFQVANTGDAHFFTPSFSSSIGAVAIIGSTDGNELSTTNAGTMFHVTGQPATPTRIISDGANSYTVFAGRRFDGNVNSPSVVQAGEIIVRYSANPYIGSNTNSGFTALGTARIEMLSTENQNTTNQGSQITLAVTPQGSNVIANVVTVSNSNVSVIGNIYANNLSLSGNISGNINANISGNVLMGNLSVTGNINSGGNISAAGNVSAQNITKNTWTPNISYAGGGSATFTTQSGSYAKVGQMVLASFTLIANASTGTGNITLTGLPFTSDGSGTNGTITFGQIAMATHAVMVGNVNSSSNTVAIFGYTQANGNNPLNFVPITAALLGTTFTLTGSVSYISAT